MYKVHYIYIYDYEFFLYVCVYSVYHVFFLKVKIMSLVVVGYLFNILSDIAAPLHR